MAWGATSLCWTEAGVVVALLGLVHAGFAVIGTSWAEVPQHGHTVWPAVLSVDVTSVEATAPVLADEQSSSKCPQLNTSALIQYYDNVNFCCNASWHHDFIAKAGDSWGLWVQCMVVPVKRKLTTMCCRGWNMDHLNHEWLVTCQILCCLSVATSLCAFLTLIVAQCTVRWLGHRMLLIIYVSAQLLAVLLMGATLGMWNSHMDADFGGPSLGWQHGWAFIVAATSLALFSLSALLVVIQIIFISRANYDQFGNEDLNDNIDKWRVSYCASTLEAEYQRDVHIASTDDVVG